MGLIEAIPVAVTGITTGSLVTGAGAWSLVALSVVALIKAWPVLSKQATDAKTALRGENRADLKSCQDRLDEMGHRLDLMEAQSHSFEMKLLGALTAYRIVEVAHERDCPGSVAVEQARTVLRTAFEVSEIPANMGELLRKANFDKQIDRLNEADRPKD